MASVTFSGVYLHDGGDLTSYIHFTSAKIVASPSVTGEIRTYAGGIDRLILRESDHLKVAVNLGLVTRTNRETLEDWRGDTLLYRDGRGRICYGTFLSMDAEEVPGDQDYARITLQLQQITQTAEV